MSERKLPRGFLVLPFLAAFLIHPSLPGQPTGDARAFDLQAYYDHLARVSDLETEPFLELHRPFGPYRRGVPAWSSDPDYLAEVSTFLELTPGEGSLLRRNGFVVSERLRRHSFGRGLLEAWHADLPVYLSTDVFLHALHRSFLQVQMDLERLVLLPRLEEALARMHADWGALADRYAGEAPMDRSVADLDVYLAVARTLLAAEPRPARGPNQAEVDQILRLIAAEVPASIALFNEQQRIVDFSQFRVRGYYTRHPDLERWFRAMMWLGRVDFRLTPPPGVSATNDVRREIVDAFLLRELAHEPYVHERLDAIDRVIRTFVGEPDNTTLDDLDRMAGEIGLGDARELWTEETMAALDALLTTDAYQPQAINSRILLSDPMAGEPLDPPHAFLLMGQRFVVDSYIFWNVVYDRIVYQGGRPFRGLPEPLEAMYVLGNDDALPLLQEELDRYHHAGNLSALRYLVEGYEEEFWDASLYNRWLDAIRSLAHTGRQAGAPAYMRTVAWQQEKMNTQLASWAELRHDTLLYAKQSYSGGVTCSYPRAYLEPVPQFYDRLRRFAATARTRLGMLGIGGWEIGQAIDFFADMEETLAPLVVIADKELAGEPLTVEEVEYLQSSLSESEGCGAIVEHGWLTRLYYGYSDAPASTGDRVVADVHTQPTDESGAPVGKVLHVGTGDPLLGVFVAETGNWPATAFVGPVASYHELVTHDFDRYTDERWSELYDTESRPPHPDWTWIYLADARGNERTGGRSLLDEVTLPVEDPEDPPGDEPTPVRTRVLAVRNYPNPFNPRTLVAFQLEGRKSAAVRAQILDARGRFVRTLLDEELEAGRQHLVEWRGDDSQGIGVASGVYYVRIEVDGAAAVHHKMSLLR